MLPSGAQRINLYTKPEKHGAFFKDRLIKIPDDILKELVEKYDRPDLFAFGTLEGHYARGSTEKLESPSWLQEMDGIYSGKW